MRCALPDRLPSTLDVRHVAARALTDRTGAIKRRAAGTALGRPPYCTRSQRMEGNRLQRITRTNRLNGLLKEGSWFVSRRLRILLGSVESVPIRAIRAIGCV